MAAFQLPALPGSQGLPVQFVITTTDPLENLYDVTQTLLSRAKASGNFFFIDSDMKIDKPQATLSLDRELVGDMGLTQQDVGASLGAALGGGYVNYFSIAGRSYKVIPQVLQKDRLNPSQVLDYYVHGGDGSLIKAGTVAHIATTTVPESINHFQQLNAATISAAPGVSQETALKYLRDTLKEIAPSGYTADYSGQSRQFMLGSGSFMVTLLFALIIVYLALAAQFESFRDPTVILVSVPMALFGAMLFINAGASTLNIYTQVGLVTLLGLISKHGILIVQFANELQRAGSSKMQAIVERRLGAAAAHSDDHRGDGAGRRTAGDRLRRRCRRAALHGHRAVHRLVHRHPVHAAGGPGDVHPAQRGSWARGRAARRGAEAARSGTLIYR